MLAASAASARPRVSTSAMWSTVPAPPEAMIYEASDLVYHLLVLLEATGCSIADLEKELARRHS